MTNTKDKNQIAKELLNQEPYHIYKRFDHILNELVEEYEADINPTTTHNFLLQTLILGANPTNRSLLIEKFQYLIKIDAVKRHILSCYLWIYWARAFEEDTKDL
ncbi:gp567 [Bacillus phage G]|uniref:Gp567 n=1 Tax=Bacillus phage G TaxID=2884420 RepID=G3MAU7_9CAUD|nr:gp567 [Bacillus phage G]AEO93813.1 gp567 [Bacillus phage G]